MMIVQNEKLRIFLPLEFLREINVVQKTKFWKIFREITLRYIESIIELIWRNFWWNYFPPGLLEIFFLICKFAIKLQVYSKHSSQSREIWFHVKSDGQKNSLIYTLWMIWGRGWIDWVRGAAAPTTVKPLLWGSLIAFCPQGSTKMRRPKSNM